MEVGIEDCLHIEFEYDKSAYHLQDVVIGKVRCPIGQGSTVRVRRMPCPVLLINITPVVCRLTPLLLAENRQDLFG